MTLSVQLLQIPSTETVTTREFYLTGASFTVGRDFGSDICLPDLAETIAPTHLVVSRTPSGEYAINDTSISGAILNGKPLPPKQPQPLQDGDVVSLAGYKLLFGIVESARKKEPVNDFPERRFVVETDMSDDAPLLPDQEIEEAFPELDMGFSGSGMELDADLMFDPFAEGPALREPPISEPRPQPAAVETAFSEAGEVMEMTRYQTTVPALQNAHLRTSFYREQVSTAMERALERFLDEIDPAVLQEDYDEYIPRLVSRQKRYWKIHSRQFSRKKASGEFRRTFLALFAEEMRKL